ncbi:MAG: V-type ATP synthase subunit F [Clostridia bacterium]|nr:V-type ATP synthase subunit F [Clostridia bacterium]
MKMYVISDNNDTFTGLKLAGVDGVVVHTEEEVIAAVERVLTDPSVGIILITEKLRTLADSYISGKMSKLREPLFLAIPDRHGASSQSGMSEFIRTSIGLKL